MSGYAQGENSKCEHMYTIVTSINRRLFYSLQLERDVSVCSRQLVVGMFD